jgi:hypothetical protein
MLLMLLLLPEKVSPQKAENLAKADAKGIPRDQLGPSGQPEIIVKKVPTRKRAEDYQQAAVDLFRLM